MADMELALRRADSAGIIDYQSGSSTFNLLRPEEINQQQTLALDKMTKQLLAIGSTGVSNILDEVLFNQLDRIVVYPVQDEGQWTDGDGKILPDALVVPNGIEAKKLAYLVHTDLGNGFIKGIDGRTKRTVGAEHSLTDGAVLKIHSKN